MPVPLEQQLVFLPGSILVKAALKRWSRCAAVSSPTMDLPGPRLNLVALGS